MLFGVSNDSEFGSNSLYLDDISNHNDLGHNVFQKYRGSFHSFNIPKSLCSVMNLKEHSNDEDRMSVDHLPSWYALNRIPPWHSSRSAGGSSGGFIQQSSDQSTTKHDRNQVRPLNAVSAQRVAKIEELLSGLKQKLTRNTVNTQRMRSEQDPDDGHDAEPLGNPSDFAQNEVQAHDCIDCNQSGMEVLYRYSPLKVFTAHSIGRFQREIMSQNEAESQQMQQVTTLDALGEKQIATVHDYDEQHHDTHSILKQEMTTKLHEMESVSQNLEEEKKQIEMERATLNTEQDRVHRYKMTAQQMEGQLDEMRKLVEAEKAKLESERHKFGEEVNAQKKEMAQNKEETDRVKVKLRAKWKQFEEQRQKLKAEQIRLHADRADVDRQKVAAHETSVKLVEMGNKLVAEREKLEYERSQFERLFGRQKEEMLQAERRRIKLEAQRLKASNNSNSNISSSNQMQQDVEVPGPENESVFEMKSESTDLQLRTQSARETEQRMKRDIKRIVDNKTVYARSAAKVDGNYAQKCKAQPVGLLKQTDVQQQVLEWIGSELESARSELRQQQNEMTETEFKQLSAKSRSLEKSHEALQQELQHMASQEQSEPMSSELWEAGRNQVGNTPLIQNKLLTFEAFEWNEQDSKQADTIGNDQEPTQTRSEVQKWITDFKRTLNIE